MEVSEGGSEILRHDGGAADFELAVGHDENIKAITEHINESIGETDGVFHELVSDQVHIDIHIVSPGTNRDFYTLVSSGMSDKPMTVPEGAEEYRFAEVAIQLPPTWKCDLSEKANEEDYWPIRLLKTMARFPHLYGTWLTSGHTVPMENMFSTTAKSMMFGGIVILHPALLPDDFAVMHRFDGNKVHFYSVIPLYTEEMNYKLKSGLGRFDGSNIGLSGKIQNPKNGVSLEDLFIINSARRNVCNEPKKSFWPFGRS